MDDSKTCEVHQPSDDVSVWVDNGASIMLKAIAKFGDPVELTAEDAREVAALLLRLADQIS